MRILPLLLLCFPIFAQDLDLLKSDIWHRPAKELSSMAFDIGKLCEYAAFMYVSEQFDETEYYFERNLTYGESSDSTGELDIIVFRTKDNRAIQIYEVKCQRNEERAFEEAEEQIKRFKAEVRKCKRNTRKHVYVGKNKRIPHDDFKGVRFDVLMPKAKSKLKVERFNITLAEVYALQRYLRTGLGF